MHERSLSTKTGKGGQTFLHLLVSKGHNVAAKCVCESIRDRLGQQTLIYFLEVDNEEFVVPWYYTGPPGLEIINPTAGESDLSITAIQEGSCEASEMVLLSQVEAESMLSKGQGRPGARGKGQGRPGARGKGQGFRPRRGKGQGRKVRGKGHQFYVPPGSEVCTRI